MKIKEKMFQSGDRKFVFIWIPSHTGIDGNERADLLAREAASLPEEDIADFPITLKDLKGRKRKHYRETMSENWENVDPAKNKLRKIKKILGRTKNLKFLKRRGSVKISRLRLGHTSMTHLMTKENPTICECGSDLTVAHIFNSCPK